MIRARRVVITGIGAITPIGSSCAEYQTALFEGRSGVGPITQFDCAEKNCSSGEYEYSTRIAGEVKNFNPEPFLKKAHRYDRATQFALSAARMCLEDAGLTLEGPLLQRTGVLMGTGMGDMRTIEAATVTVQTKGASRIHPTSLPKVLPNSLVANMAIYLGTRGPSFGLSSACASSTHAIGEASWIIRRGDAELMIAGGAEAAITPLSIAGFGAMRVMSRRNDNPAAASRPFDRDRDGFVMGEGAGMIVLESLESAESRGAKIYAELLGYGVTADAYHIADMRPDAAEPARAIRLALERAEAQPQDIDYVNAHGTSTRINDVIETRAIKEIFRRHATSVPISSTKSMIGHLLSASGAVETIATLLSIRHQTVHSTINLEHPDSECDLDYVGTRSRPHAIRLAMKNSFGFGGHNAVLVFRRWPE